MSKLPPSTASGTPQTSDLRRQAEEILRGKGSPSPENRAGPSLEEVRTLHELRVHQVELEMQNEELRRVQEQVEILQAKYFDLFDLAPVGYVTLSEEGYILEANLTVADFLGLARSALVNQFLTRFILPEDQDLYYRHRRLLLDIGKPQVCELRLLKSDDSEFWVRLDEVAARDGDGSAVYRAVLIDINERKQVAEALRKAEEKYSLAFRASPDWCAITTLDEGVFVEVNKAFERLSGFGREEVLGKSAIELGIWDQPEQRRCLIDLMRRQGTVHNFEVRFRLVSGEVGTFILSADMIELEGESLMLTVARDITELRGLEAQLRQAQKMEAVGRLAGGVAHDFNNMLGVILGYTDLALKRLNAQEPLYHDLQEVNNAARRSADLTRQLLAFSRKQIVTPRVINLNDLVLQQQKMLSRLIGEDIDLKVILGQDLWNIRLDSSQVDQILANLTVNARDAIAGVGTLPSKRPTSPWMRAIFRATATPPPGITCC
jgi:PAS domain S-box-containing protein